MLRIRNQTQDSAKYPVSDWLRGNIITGKVKNVKLRLFNMFSIIRDKKILAGNTGRRLPSPLPLSLAKTGKII
jgi:hypothetical protein